MEDIGYRGCTSNVTKATPRGRSSPCCSGGDKRLSAPPVPRGGCCGGANVTECSGNNHKKQELSLEEAAAQLPFAAAGMEVEQQDDLEVLADLPGSDQTDVVVVRGGTSSVSSASKCAFRLDGKPCKLCNEEEEDVKEEENENYRDKESNCDGSRCSEEGDCQELVKEEDVADEKGAEHNFLVPLVLLAANVAERKEELQKKEGGCCNSSSGCKGKAATSAASSCSPQQQVSKEREEKLPLDAYERKKVKQKNVRVQLNRALDELGSAMQQATEQSIVRATQLGQGGELKKSSSLVEPLRTTLVLPEGGQNCHRIDRPSLVGAAANMLNDMNQHCETLALEVLRLRQQLSQVNNHNHNNHNHDSMNKQQDSFTATCSNGQKGSSTTSCCNSRRKRKLEEIQTTIMLGIE